MIEYHVTTNEDFEADRIAHRAALTERHGLTDALKEELAAAQEAERAVREREAQDQKAARLGELSAIDAALRQRQLAARAAEQEAAIEEARRALAQVPAHNAEWLAEYNAHIDAIERLYRRVGPMQAPLHKALSRLKRALGPQWLRAWEQLGGNDARLFLAEGAVHLVPDKRLEHQRRLGREGAVSRLSFR